MRSCWRLTREWWVQGKESTRERNICKTDGTRTLWGEEEDDGIIYSVHLRKIRYSVSKDPTPTFTDPTFKLDQVSPPTPASPAPAATTDSTKDAGLLSETRRDYSIKAATLEKLVEHLSQAMNQMNSSFINVFLNTYQTFTTASKVLDLLLQRYKSVSDKNNNPNLKKGTRVLIQKSVQSILTMWLDEYSEGFREPPSYPCLTTLMEFAEKHMTDKEIAEKCRRKLEKWKEKDDVFGLDLSGVTLSFDAPRSPSENNFTFSICEEVDYMMDCPKEFTFQEMEDDFIADQLTYLDADLFKKVIPQHCLGAIWSKREKDESVATTVKATVDQFNKVSYHVISTILRDAAAKPSQRAKVVTKWIYVAQECRNLKNFSSLKAILSGLQASCIHRLKKTWAAVPRDAQGMYDELTEIFSEDNNHEAWREILMKEGTAKFVESSSSNQSRTMRRQSSKKSLRRIDSTVIHGTVPYLGTFLTDLMMIHTAYPDVLENGYINFEKKKKEFELLAQIKLLQKAAQNYHIQGDGSFERWFNGVKIYSDDQSYQLSCIIEPLSPSSRSRSMKDDSAMTKPKRDFGFRTLRRKSEFFQWSSSGSSTSSEDRSSLSSSESPPSDFRRLSRSSSCSSFLSLDSALSSPSVQSSTLPVISLPFFTETSCIIKISLDEEERQGNMYKSILLGNEEHTSAVIGSALSKHCKEDQPTEEYSLIQILDDGELEIPDKCNVFYAINQGTPDLKFILRRKSSSSPGERRPVIKKRNNKMKLTLKRPSSVHV
ncbi:ral guanine nucleotide dissociation stimulator-like 1 isoform X2 [Ptychodera flava]|uniref:ral guanine nucleotide dissociation stimulator-like 1 isoform X2 n=1 Tax=Ptychodera flava TaxID=63121 RepID=UPI003969CF43